MRLSILLYILMYSGLCQKSLPFMKNPRESFYVRVINLSVSMQSVKWNGFLTWVFEVFV